MSAFCVGLTGGLASGKTTTADLFAAHGITVIDADIIARQLTAPDGEALPALHYALGDWAFTAAGCFDRTIVRQRIFADPTLRQKLEAVLHPRIRQTMQAQLQNAPPPYAIGVVPLLFENPGWADFFQHIVVIYCDAEIQQQRANDRDKISDAKQIMAAQMPLSKRRQYADTLLNNNGDLTTLKQTVNDLHKKFIQFADNHPLRRQ